MKKILLTGATDGIGLATAQALAEKGHHLLLHGRNAEKLHHIQTALTKHFPHIQVETYTADLSLLDDVRNMAQQILEKHTQLHIVINNAGVFVVPEQKRTNKDGIDVRLVVNTIAPYVLTKMLLPIIDPEGRIINLGSAAQAPVDFAAFTSLSLLSDDAAYAQSKLALTMWTMALAEMHPQGPSFITVNPKSFLGSKMVQEAYGRQGHDVRIGADILCQAALSQSFDNANGKYFDNDYGTFANPHPFALVKENRQQLLTILQQF